MGDYTCPTECVERNHPGREHEEWLDAPDRRDELAAANRRTVKLAYDSMLNVDRKGWTDEEWVADAHRLMDHIDGSAACLLNGHILALFRSLAHARAQALREAAEALPEVGDVLRGMAAREVGDE